MAAALAPLRDHPHVAEVRQTGMIVAIEMVKDKATREPYDFRERRGLAVYRHALQHGALLRPIGNVVYFMPPYVIEPEEIDFLARTARARHRGCHMRLIRVFVDAPLAPSALLPLPAAGAASGARAAR